jgi:hypothetical protein
VHHAQRRSAGFNRWVRWPRYRAPQSPASLQCMGRAKIEWSDPRKTTINSRFSNVNCVTSHAQILLRVAGLPIRLEAQSRAASLRNSSRRGLAPTLSWTLIGDSHTGGRSIGLPRGYAARHSFDGSCGNAIRSNCVQPRPLGRRRYWTGGVWGWRRTGGRICPGVAFGCRFGCPRRRSGWCGLRRR